MTETPRPTITLRPYQVDARKAIYGEFRSVRSTLLVLPTGTGKTQVFASIVADGVRAGRRVLVLAHRDVLIEQAAKTIARAIDGEVGVEKGDRRDASEPAMLLVKGTGRVVVSSVQTMKRRLAKVPTDSFDLVIRDEAHHCRSDTDQSILAHFASAKILGVTATPNRGDKKALGEVFNSVAYDMSIADAIGEGWLVPVRQRAVDVPELDLSMVSRKRGDFDRNQLAEVMESLDMLRAVSVPTVKFLEGRQALVFCVSVAHATLQAESIREVMRELGLAGEVASLDGSMPKSVQGDIVARFEAGQVRAVTSCDLITEGFDAPPCSLVVMARPTQSKALYLQILGRGTRTLPGVVDGPGTETAAMRRAAIAASAKPDMLVLDLVGNTGKHDMVHAADLLGGDGEDQDVKEAEKILARGDTDDLMKAIELARSLRFGRDRAKLARDGDFFAIFGLVRETDRWGREMTPRQREVLAKSDVPLMGIDWRGANQAITETIRRRERGLCNYKQARVLVRARVPLLVVERASFDGASAAISRLGAANWHPTGDSWWRDTLARADQHQGCPAP
jgi:superfamily II DNA or RNA helicase